jgi:hypothetical protein
MNLAEYASHDASGLAALVASRRISPTELARTAAAAIAAINPASMRSSRPTRIASSRSTSTASVRVRFAACRS